MTKIIIGLLCVIIPLVVAFYVLGFIVLQVTATAFLFAIFFDIKSVPIIGEGTLTEAIERTRKGEKSTWGDFTSEGIVARPKTELLTRRGERIITKIKHRDFV